MYIFQDIQCSQGETCDVEIIPCDDTDAPCGPTANCVCDPVTVRGCEQTCADSGERRREGSQCNECVCESVCQVGYILLVHNYLMHVNTSFLSETKSESIVTYLTVQVYARYVPAR